MKVPPSTIKTDGIFLTNREEQFSATPLEDRQSRRNFNLQLQGTPICQPRINENQEGLTEEEHTTVYIIISWIGLYREKLNTRRGPAQQT